MKKLTRRTIQLVTHNGVPSYRTFASEEGHYVASYEVAELERAYHHTSKALGLALNTLASEGLWGHLVPIVKQTTEADSFETDWMSMALQLAQLIHDKAPHLDKEMTKILTHGPGSVQEEKS